MTNFEKYLQDSFINMREIGGIGITKDNCENLFDAYLERMDKERLMELADIYAESRYKDGQLEILKKQIKKFECNQGKDTSMLKNKNDKKITYN